MTIFCLQRNNTTDFEKNSEPGGKMGGFYQLTYGGVYINIKHADIYPWPADVPNVPCVKMVC